MVNERLVNLFGKGRTTTEKVSTLLEPKVTSFFRAIQGHSGSNLVDPALQENVLLPEDFSEYIYHVGNVSEIHFNNQKWTDPRRKKSHKRQAVRVFHCSEPDGRRSKHCRKSIRLGQAKDRTIQKYLESSSKKQCIDAI